MNSKQTKQVDIQKLILSSFHLDKLCPRCEGPMEIDNNISCRLCSLKKTLKPKIDIAESAIYSMKTDIR